MEGKIQNDTQKWILRNILKKFSKPFTATRLVDAFLCIFLLSTFVFLYFSILMNFEPILKQILG